MRSALLLALLLPSTILIASRPAAHAAPAPARGAYFALGDSVAAGSGTSLPRTRSYPALVRGWLEAQLGATIPYQNFAVPGETVASFMSGGQFDRFKAAVADQRQAGLPILAASVTLGGNEMLEVAGASTAERQTQLDAFRQSYPSALAQIRAQAPEATLVVTTYYDPTEGDATLQFSDAWWIAQFNAVISDAAAQQSAIVADVNAGFRHMIAEYTHYPLDVHPTNAGDLALARLVWSALKLDTQPPTIAIQSSSAAVRRTPTLRFTVNEPTGLSEVSVHASAGTASPPLDDGQGGYRALLDFTAIDGTTATVTIEAMDEAGNVATQMLQLTLPAKLAAPAASPAAPASPTAQQP